MNEQSITPTNDRLERYIGYFERQLEHIRDVGSITDLETVGWNNLSSALSVSKEVEFLVSELSQKEGQNPELVSKHKLYEGELNSTLETTDGQEQALKELDYRLDRYPVKVCHFLHLDPLSNEIENHLSWRDSIEFLLIELESHATIHERKVRVETLDEVLRCRYEEGIDKIFDKCPTVERPYYPESFWWRHPSRVAKELESP